MQVTILANTQLHGDGIDKIESKYPLPTWIHGEASELAEFAGRLCYRAWSKSNPATATNEGYIANLIDHKHFSVLEHGSVTFLFEGVSRALTHELVRHRHFSFSQVSGRYVDQTYDEVAIPDVVKEMMAESELVNDIVSKSLAEASNVSAAILSALKAKGLKKKAAQQAARFILPTNLTTDIVVTGNHRSWREFIDKRYSEFADPEIRTLAGQVLIALKDLEPNIYQDLDLKDFDTNGGIDH